MFFYNLAIRCYTAFIWLAAFFNQKARLWIEGRKNWKERLTHQIQQSNIKDPVWFHCASLGEFEQGRPLMEAIKEQFPKQQILLTFFSPSGFEIRKNYEFADAVLYMPVDTKAHAKTFIEIVKPKMAVFVKYEFWLNFLFQLQQQSVPTFLVSAVFKQHQPFFKWYGSVFRKALGCYQFIFTQDQGSLQLLHTLGLKQAIVAGDTRFDRVLQVCANPATIESIRQFTEHSFTMIGGSTWPKDETFLLNVFSELKQAPSPVKLIIAPHEIHQSNIDRLIRLISGKGFSYQLIDKVIPNDPSDVIIVNTMGYLSSLYQYGKVAVIGGGFDNGIHNILEPSVYGLPVLFGPNYHKFNEAEELIHLKGAFGFSSQEELLDQLSLLINNQTAYAAASAQAKNYVKQNAGATGKIMEYLKSLL